MAKDLPYFKFIVSDWMNGNITLEDMETQGLFINICAYYWHKSGDLFLSEIKRRFKDCKPTAFNSLIDSSMIKIVGDKISIEFLNEQLIDRGYISKVNSENGKLGGRPKAAQTQEEKPTAFNSLSDLKAKESNIEKRRTEENKKEESKEEIYNVEEFVLDKPKRSVISKTLYSQCVDYWLKVVHIGWTFTGQHGKQIKSIITKLRAVQIEGGKNITDENLLIGFEFMCKNLPEYYKDKDLAIIDSKFNEIITQIKNGNKSTKKSESKFRSV